MAGPETREGQLSVDQIIAEGNAASAAAPSVETTTTGGAPPLRPGGGGLEGGSFEVTQPEWGFRPVQQDFGQVDVRRGQYDTGNVPTVNQQMPFAALASRQQAVAQRKEAQAQRLANYDPYGGIGKAHPRYTAAFNKYGVRAMDDWYREQADKLHGGDLAETHRWAATDPQGIAARDRRAKEVESIGAENATWVDSGIELLATANQKGFYIPPETRKYVEQFIGAVDADGMPVQGMSPEEFLPMRRDFEFALAELQYINAAIEPVMRDAFSRITKAGAPVRDKTGKFRVTSEEQKSFDEAIDAYLDSPASEDYVGVYHGGDRDKAKRSLKAYYPTSVTEKVQHVSPYDAPESGSGGSGSVVLGDWESAPSTAISEVDKDAGVEAFSPDASSTEFVRDKVVRRPVFEETGDKRVPMGPKRFAAADGSPIEVSPQYVEVDEDGNGYVVGTVATEKETVTYTTSERMPDGSVKDVIKTVNTASEQPTVRIPASNNKASFSAYLGKDWMEGAPASGGSEKAKADITESEYNKLKKGDKYWFGGRQLTKE